MCGKWFTVVLVFLYAEIEALQHAENNMRRRGIRVRHELRNSTEVSRRSCSNEQLESQLARMEAQIAENSRLLTSQMTEIDHRLKSIAWRNVDIQADLEELHNQNENNSHNIDSDNLDLKIDNLAKGLQVVVAALRAVKSDIESLNYIISSNSVRRGPDPYQQQHSIPANCKEIQERGNNFSGVYQVQTSSAPKPFLVLCDMDTAGGGWTYIHNRYKGQQDFYLGWKSYKTGFGNLGGEFWLGLEYIHRLTGDGVNELLVELADLDEKRAYAHYEAFSVGSEEEGYALRVLGGYTGNAGDSLIYHAGSKFSAKDMDQDEWQEGSCAQAHYGAWWYKSCDNSNLNGRYLKGEVPESSMYQGLYWGGFHGKEYSLLRARMMVRPRRIRLGSS